MPALETRLAAAEQGAAALYYAGLTLAERIPPLLAATARDDLTEADRLAATAPKIVVQMPDLLPRLQALQMLALHHGLQLLDLLIDFNRLSDLMDLCDCEATDPRKQARWVASQRLLATVLTAHADGWREFCGDLNIDPEALLCDLPGFNHLQREEARFRSLAYPTAEEANAVVFDNDKMPAGVSIKAKVITASDVADAMRERLEQLGTIKG